MAAQPVLPASPRAGGGGIDRVPSRRRGRPAAVLAAALPFPWRPVAARRAACRRLGLSERQVCDALGLLLGNGARFCHDDDSAWVVLDGRRSSRAA